MHPSNASILAGDRLALARLLTQVENDTLTGRAALGELFPHTGRAHLIGVTGAPGTGKSSLVNQLARHYRLLPTPQRVAIIAVDPSSPFTGGALLGDRVRMRDLSGDPGVFIRSMAARSSLGGLAAATADMTQAFDAAGFEVILIETVGAGQSEVDIARLAHTTLVIEAPGLGDDIQAIKAGILEIADILVINKADQPGADNTERALRSMLELAHPMPHVFRHHGQFTRENLPPAADTPLWLPPVQRTVATQGSGIADLAEAIYQHRQHLEHSGEWRRREQTRLESEMETLLQETLVARWRANLSENHYQTTLAALFERRISPHAAVEQLLSPTLYA
jgi:LAO/AO transport system kinase